MRTSRGVALVPVLLLVLLLAGCGKDDNGSNSSPTTVFNQTATSAVSGGSPAGATSTSTGPGGVVQGVIDGNPCTPQGARGTTSGGAAELCTQVGGDLRWRPA